MRGVRRVLSGATCAESHMGWMADMLAAGWRYGSVKDAAARTHPCLVPYAGLDPGQRDKDALFAAIVHVMGVSLRKEDDHV